MIPSTIDMRLRRGREGMRVTAGSRLEIERRCGTLFEGAEIEHPVLGSCWASRGFDLAGWTRDQVDSWELEIGEAAADADDLAPTLRATLGHLLPDDCVTELNALANAVTTEPMPWAR